MQSTQIMAMYGTDGFDMVQRLLEQMDAVSHLPQDKHASIAIKPNLVVAHTADTGATTHPEIIEGIICYLQAQGYDNLSIIESVSYTHLNKEAGRACRPVSFFTTKFFSTIFKFLL